MFSENNKTMESVFITIFRQGYKISSYQSFKRITLTIVPFNQTIQSLLGYDALIFVFYFINTSQPVSKKYNSPNVPSRPHKHNSI